MMDQTYRFKELGQESLDAVLELEYLLFSAPWSKEQYTLLMQAGGCRLFGVFQEDRLCAYAAAGLAAVLGEAEIYNLAVHPCDQRKHLGQQLLRLVLAEAERLGLARAVLEVRAGNQAALGLYRKLGFTHCGARPVYYNNPVEDALILERGFPVTETR